MSEQAEIVHLPAQPLLRRDVSELAGEADQIREMQRAVLKHDVDYGTIPGTKKPSLYKSGAEWLLKWGRFAHRFEVVEVERDEGRRYGITYRCLVSALDAPEVVVATCDGYCGYDEPDREAHVNKWGKQVERSPWNTVIKMAQKRALIGATLQATGTSGLFTQDVEDYAQPSDSGSSMASKEPEKPAPEPSKCVVCGNNTRRQHEGQFIHAACESS